MMVGEWIRKPRSSEAARAKGGSGSSRFQTAKGAREQGNGRSAGKLCCWSGECAFVTRKAAGLRFSLGCREQLPGSRKGSQCGLGGRAPPPRRYSLHTPGYEGGSSRGRREAAESQKLIEYVRLLLVHRRGGRPAARGAVGRGARDSSQPRCLFFAFPLLNPSPFIVANRPGPAPLLR